jgi:hypothetical protein
MKTSGTRTIISVHPSFDSMHTTLENGGGQRQSTHTDFTYIIYSNPARKCLFLLLTFLVTAALPLCAGVRHEPGNLDYFQEGKYASAISKQAHGEANVALLETRGTVSLFHITSSSERPETSYISFWEGGRNRLRARQTAKDMWLVDFGEARRFTVNVLLAGDNHVFPFLVER